MQSDAKSNRDFGLQSFQLMSGKSFRIQEHLKTQSGEENSSNPVGHLVLTLSLDSGTFIEGLSKIKWHHISYLPTRDTFEGTKNSFL